MKKLQSMLTVGIFLLGNGLTVCFQSAKLVPLMAGQNVVSRDIG